MVTFFYSDIYHEYLIKKESSMNKMVLVLLCATVSSFLSAMEQNPNKSSSRNLDTLNNLRSQQSPRALTIVQPDGIPTRSRVPSDPLLRVRSQSNGSDMFLKEENIGQKKSEPAFIRKRGASDGQ